MSEIREIVTKAIVEKGKKQIRFTTTVNSLNNVESILGCFVLNHSFSANRIKEAVEVNGKFELNVWYSHSSNTKTDVVKQVITYDKVVRTKKTIKSYIEDNNDVIVKMLQQPICNDVKIVDDNIEIEIMFEVECEVIGETKIKVNVLEGAHIYDPNENDDYLDDIENEINPQFINEKIF